MPDKNPRKKRWIIFGVAGSVVIVLGVMFGVSAFLEWRWQDRHERSVDSYHARSADFSRVAVSGTVIQSNFGKEGESSALKLQTTAFGGLDCTFENGQEDQIKLIKAGEFIVVEGEVVEAAHQFLKCKLIRTWHNMQQ